MDDRNGAVVQKHAACLDAIEKGSESNLGRARDGATNQGWPFKDVARAKRAGSVVPGRCISSNGPGEPGPPCHGPTQRRAVAGWRER